MNFYPFVKWQTRRAYIKKELREACIADLQADLSADRAREKRALAAQLVKEAEGIEESIKREEETPEYKALEGKDLYEANQEKKDAERIAENKRATAASEESQAQDSEQTAKHFRRMAGASRETAERLRRI